MRTGWSREQGFVELERYGTGPVVAAPKVPSVDSLVDTLDILVHPS